MEFNKKMYYDNNSSSQKSHDTEKNTSTEMILF